MTAAVMSNDPHAAERAANYEAGKARGTQGKPLMRFRLMYGMHTESYDTGEYVEDHPARTADERATLPKWGTPKKGERTFRARRRTDPVGYDGDVIETHRDLEALFNDPKQGPDGQKFRRMYEDDPKYAPPPPARDEFDNMSVDALLDFADDEGIDLSKIVPDRSRKLDKSDRQRVKPALVAAIRGHVPAREAKGAG